MGNKKLKDQIEKVRQWAKENGVELVEREGDGKVHAVFKPKEKKNART